MGDSEKEADELTGNAKKSAHLAVTLDYSRKAGRKITSGSDDATSDVGSVRSKKQDSDLDMARAIENLESSKSELSILRCTTAEAKLDRLASWADTQNAHLFEPPCDFSELPRRLQAALHWMLKHLRSHREGISFLAHAVKPWQQVVSGSRNAKAENTSSQISVPAPEDEDEQRPMSEVEASSTALPSGKGAGEDDTAISEDPCDDDGKDKFALPPSAELIAFDVVALSWMVQTEGNLGQKGKQLDEIEESIKVLRMRVDKVVTDFSRHFKNPGRVAQNNLELLSDKEVAKRQSQDLQPSINSTNSTVGKLGRYFTTSGSFNASAFATTEEAILEDTQKSEADCDSLDSSVLPLPMDGSRRSSGDFSGLMKNKRPSVAPPTVGCDKVLTPPLTAVTRGEYTDLQHSVAVLENSHQTLVAEVNKLLLAQERRMDEVEKTASAHFKQLKDFIEIATNTATEGMEATKRASALAAASMQAAADRSSALLTRQVEEMPDAVLTPAMNQEESSAKQNTGVEVGPDAQSTLNVTNAPEAGNSSRPGSARSPRSPPHNALAPRLSDNSTELEDNDKRPRRNRFKVNSDAPVFEAIDSLRARMQTVETSVTGLTSDVTSLRQMCAGMRRASKRDSHQPINTSVTHESSPPQLTIETTSPEQQHESPEPRLNTVICGDLFDAPSPQSPPMKDLSKALNLRAKLTLQRRGIASGGPPPPARPGTPLSWRKNRDGPRRISQASSPTSQSSGAVALMMRSTASPEPQEV